jgi:two-component system, LytTR family, response regulator AgrA
MLDIVICEDDPIYLKLISYKIQQLIDIGQVSGKIVLMADNTLEVEKYLQSNHANVFLLDIDLNSKKNGYDLALIINESILKPYIVFITEHLEYVFQSFKVHPFDFLPKPVTENRLEALFGEIKRHYIRNSEEEQEEFITIKSTGRIYKIKKEDIVTIEKEVAKTIVYGVSQVIFCNLPLKYFENLLSECGIFIRCHKGSIVNKKHIVEVTKKDMKIRLDIDRECYIGRKYKKKFLEGI